MRAVHVVSEDGGAESVRGVVGQLDGLFFGVEGGDALFLLAPIHLNHNRGRK